MSDVLVKGAVEREELNLSALARCFLLLSSVSPPVTQGRSLILGPRELARGHSNSAVVDDAYDVYGLIEIDGLEVFRSLLNRGKMKLQLLQFCAWVSFLHLSRSF